MSSPAANGGTPARAALDALATTMEVGLVLLDAGRRPVFANRTALQLLGTSELDLAAAWARFQAAARAQGQGQFVVELETAEGVRSFRAEARDLAEGSEVLFKDRRRLGALDFELLCASRMSEWVHQCEALVHDANGALNTISLTLELLDGQWPGSRAGEQVHEPHRRNHIDVLRDNLGKLKGIMRELGGANDATGVAVFDVADVLREATFILRMPARRRRVDLQVVMPEATVRMKARPGHIRQALVNVMLARLDAAPEGSRLTIAAEARGDTIALVCADAATLPAEVRHEIFRVWLAEPAPRSSAAHLRLARAIIEAEGGEFEIEQKNDAATVFRFVLPAA